MSQQISYCKCFNSKSFFRIIKIIIQKLYRESLFLQGLYYNFIAYISKITACIL